MTVIFVVINTIAVGALYLILLERRVAAWIQDRCGPNRVGPWGLLQPIADTIKLLVKEEYIPRRADRVLFLLAPGLTVIPALIRFAVIPWAGTLQIAGESVAVAGADINIGIVYLVAVTSLGIYGVVLGGWASNNKYAFLGSLRAAASGQDIMIWDVATHCAVRVLRGHTRGVIDLSFSPDGRWLASCSDDETIGIWRVSDGARVRTLAGHQDYLSAVEFSPDGRWLASGGGDAVIKIWDAKTWTEQAALRGHSKSILEMAFGPNSRLLASGGFDRSILLWELDDAGCWGRTQVHE